MSHVTADWHEMRGGSEYFRKSELYSLEWSNVDLDNYCLVGGSYGGLLALVRDDSKITRVTPSLPPKPIISIYTPAGTLISSIKWDSGVLIKMGWSSSEEFLCIQEDGNVLVYSIFGVLKETLHTLSSSTTSHEKREKVVEAQIFESVTGTGVAFLTSSSSFIVISNYTHLKTRKLPSVPGEGSFSAWAVLSPPSSPIKIAAARGPDFYLLDYSNCVSLTITFNSVPNSISYISPSLNGEHVGVWTEGGNLWLGSSDFIEKYTEVPTSISLPPKQITWCGKEAVALSWDSVPHIIFISKEGGKLTFPMDSKFYFIPEIDGLRVISNLTHEIIQRVPETTKLIFGIGSVAPGSWLLEASKEYGLKSHKADDYIRCIQNLEEAVNQCICAASYEFNPTNQKTLMRAAQFGKCFLTHYDSGPYVDMCQKLRILNAVNDFKIGLPLTYTQLEQMTRSVLIDRLILRRHYALALKIADFIKLPHLDGSSRILAHWACFKVSQHYIEDGSLAKEIYNKLKIDSSISYSEISKKAFEIGRKKLALELAHYEVRKSVQVPLFLKLGDSKTALQKSVESGDSDLVYDVLLYLRDNLPLSQFQMLVRSFPTAQKLYVRYCKIFNPEAMRNIFEIEDDFLSLAQLYIEESSREKRLEGRLSALQTSAKFYVKAKNEWSGSMCDEEIKLLKHQQTLEQQYATPFMDFSLRDTLKTLLGKKEIKMAEKMRLEYRVSDRVFWLMRIDCIGKAKDWIELEKLSKPKKIPGGFEDFVEVCLKYGNKDEALKYLPKVKEDLQVKYYVEAGCYMEGANIAYSQKDVGNLEYIYSKCIGIDRELGAKVKELLDKLKPPS